MIRGYQGSSAFLPTCPSSFASYCAFKLLIMILGSLSVIEGTRESLERLQLEYVDVIFAHVPDYTGMSEFYLGN